MTRPMRKLEMVQLVKQEVRALLRLSPWLLLSLLVAAVLWSADLTTTSGLFQSPPEGTPPVITPTLTLTPTLEMTPTPAITPTATEVPPLPPAGGETGVPETPVDESERYAEEETDLAYDWGMFLDSAALMASYAWLCCGVLLFIAIPVLFVVLWVAARRRQQGEEDDV